MKQLLTRGLACFLVLTCLFQGGFTASASQGSPASQPFYLFHPLFFKDYSDWNAAITLLNRGVQTVDVALSFYGSGAPVNAARTVSPGQALRITGADLSELQSNFSGSLFLSANGPLESTVELMRGGAYSGDILALYTGQPAGAMQLTLGPFFKGTTATSISVMNAGTAAAATTWTFLDMSGNTVATQNLAIQPGAAGTFYTGSISQIPPGTQGMVIVTAGQPLVGLVTSQNYNNSTHFYQWLETYESMQTGMQMYFPRLYKGLDDGCGGRSSSVMVTNSGVASASYTLTTHHPDGSLAFAFTISNLSVGQSRLIRLAEQAELASGAAYSAVLTGSGPASAQDILEYDTPPGCASGDYTNLSGGSIDLPHLERSAGGFSIITLQNPGAAAADIHLALYQAAGMQVYTATTSVQPGGVFTLTLSSLASLGSSFFGSAVITSSTPVAAVVDQIEHVQCRPVSNVHLAYEPSLNIFTGVPVHFTATAEGDTPYSYAWSVDGFPEGQNQDYLDWIFASAGDHPVSVTVSNSCGQASAEGIVAVQSNLPDLSQSTMIANLNSVGAGDLLTYTIFLRNTGILTATATFTDPIPAHTTFSGFHQSSGQGGLTAGAQIVWNGPVIAGSPVVLELRVVVQDTTVGTAINNTARLADGVGGLTILNAGSTFNPGYSLSIDAGVIATNVPTVTLRYSWNSADSITEVKFSNDGGFGAGGSTSDWLPVNPGNPVYPGWVLATLGDLRIPRVVYVKFRDGAGTPFGPFSDDIIYDIDPPTIQNVVIIPSAGKQGLLSPFAKSVIIRVTSADDNSGVGQVQVSDTADFTSYSVFTVSGQVTDVPWELPASGKVYVRVVDRAGNLSSVDQAQGSGSLMLFLPVVVK